MQNQAFTFLIFILNGLLIGILFDIFRILRKCFKTPDFITYIEDIIFWIISGLILLYSIFKFNNGELRLFIFIGIILGLLLYMLIFSKFFISMAVSCITLINKIILIIIVTPIKYILLILNKFLYSPMKYVISKTILILKQLIQFSKKTIKKCNIATYSTKNKKDFA